jgi:hypothetical protein
LLKKDEFGNDFYLDSDGNQIIVNENEEKIIERDSDGYFVTINGKK